MKQSLLLRCLAALQRRRWVISTSFILIMLAGSLFTLLRPRVYQAVTTIEVSSATRPTPQQVGAQVEILRSSDLQEAAFDAMVWRNKKRDFGKTRLSSGALTITAKPGTAIVYIYARAKQPAAAAALANNVASAYFDRSQRGDEQARYLFEERLQDIETRLAQANAAVAAFKAKTGLISPDTQLQKTAEYLVTLQSERDAAITQMASITQSLTLLREKLRTEKPSDLDTTTFTHDPRFNTLLETLNSLNSERAKLLQEKDAHTDEIKALEARIQDTETQLKAVANSTVVSSQTQSRNPIYDNLVKEYLAALANQAATGARIAALGEALKARQTEAAVLPERERQYTQLMRQVTTLQQSYTKLQQAYNENLASMPKAKIGDWIARARAPQTPFISNVPMQLLVFALAGVACALLAAVIVERRDDRIHTLEAFATRSGLPTLGVLPQLPKGTPRLLSDAGQQTAWLEAFRILRHNIVFATNEHACKVMAVTSPGPGEGKSLTCANLAIAMAMTGKRVLVIDLDLHNPSQHQLFATASAPGFTTLLDPQAEDVAAMQQTAIANVVLLPAGPQPSHPVELLQTEQARAMVWQFAAQFDSILIDCPPCSGLSDMQVIATLVDGVILVSAVHQTQHARLDITMHMLQLAHAPLLGMVVNRVDKQLGAGYYYTKCV